MISRLQNAFYGKKPARPDEFLDHRRSDGLFDYIGRLRGSAAHLPYLNPVTTRLEANENERVLHTRRSREAQLGAFGLRVRFG